MKIESDAAAITGGVKSAERVLQLLELFGSTKHPLTLKELSTATGIPRSSAHALIATLRAHGWIELVDGDDGYRLATRALTVGVSYLDRDPAAPHAVATLETIREKLCCTTNYARRVDDGVVYLATRESADRRSLPSRLGRRMPAYTTALGRVLLAELADAEARAIIESSERVKLTSRTTVDVDDLFDEVREAREKGYAIEVGQTIDDIVCIAVPVPYRLPSTDAISCSLAESAATPERIDEVVQVLTEEVTKLARELRKLGVK